MQIKSNGSLSGEGKPEYPEKNLSEQRRQPTNPGYIGEKRVLSPPRHPCTLDASKMFIICLIIASFIVFVHRLAGNNASHKR